MKRFIKIISLLACFTFLCTACEPQSQTREVVSQVEETSVSKQQKNVVLPNDMYWGMDKKDIQRIEKGDGRLSKEKILRYGNREIFGYSADVGYSLSVDDKLLVIGYTIPQSSLESDKGLVCTFLRIKYSIEDEYGVANLQDEEIWSANKYKYSEDDVIQAVCNNDLEYSSMWLINDTAINIVLKADEKSNHIPTIYLMYGYYTE